MKPTRLRLRARRDAAGVRLITRNGNDFTKRFPLAAAAVAALPGRSCLIDGEAIACDDKGLAVFELIRRSRNHASAILCAFDLLEIDGEDLRRVPIEHRKHRLARLLRSPQHGLVLNEHFNGDGAVIFISLAEPEGGHRRYRFPTAAKAFSHGRTTRIGAERLPMGNWILRFALASCLLRIQGAQKPKPLGKRRPGTPPGRGGILS